MFSFSVAGSSILSTSRKCSYTILMMLYLHVEKDYSRQAEVFSSHYKEYSDIVETILSSQQSSFLFGLDIRLTYGDVDDFLRQKCFYFSTSLVFDDSFMCCLTKFLHRLC